MRCVVRGFLQRNGVDFGTTYSPTAMMSSLSILLTAAVTIGWDIYELDVKNAYCHGIIDRETYISFPGGISLADHKDDRNPRGLRLKKEFYGTHQGGRLRFHRYKKELIEELGFKQCHYDPSIFIRRRNGKVIYVAIYVDDSLITGSDTEGIQHLRDHIIKTFGDTTWVINSFLNLHMKHEKHKGRIEMRYTYYRKNILADYNPLLDIQANTPYYDDPTSKMKRDEIRHGTILENYRSIAPSWIYDSSACASSQAHALSLLCARVHDPSKMDAMKLDQYMRYMARHLDDPYVIQRPGQDPTPDLNISGFTDSSFADKSDTQARATKGAIHFTTKLR
jgi:hypothetical protein